MFRICMFIDDLSTVITLYGLRIFKILPFHWVEEDLDPAMAFLHTLLEAMTREISSNMFNSVSILLLPSSLVLLALQSWLLPAFHREENTHVHLRLWEDELNLYYGYRGQPTSCQTRAKFFLFKYDSIRLLILIDGTFLTIDQSIYLHFMANQQYEFLKFQKMCPGGLYLSRNNDVFTLFVFGFKPEVEQTMV